MRRPSKSKSLKVIWQTNRRHCYSSSRSWWWLKNKFKIWTYRAPKIKRHTVKQWKKLNVTANHKVIEFKSSRSKWSMLKPYKLKLTHWTEKLKSLDMCESQSRIQKRHRAKNQRSTRKQLNKFRLMLTTKRCSSRMKSSSTKCKYVNLRIRWKIMINNSEPKCKSLWNKHRKKKTNVRQNTRSISKIWGTV